MRNLPNAITLLRFALIPALVVLLVQRDFDLAFALFIVSALSDLADGWVARRWNLRSRFGAIADPLADKLTMLSVTVLLALLNWLPWWFAAAIVLRDVLIVGGATAYHCLIGRVEIAPTRLSKLNTVLEFVLLACVLAVAAELADDGAWRAALMLAVLATVVLSGAQYVVEWSRRASRGNLSQ